MKWLIAIVALALVVGGVVLIANNQDQSTTVTASSTPASKVDVTKLPLGDKKISTAPQRDYLYSCQTTFNQPGGAGTDGPWIHGSTWNLNEKVKVDGSVNWSEAAASVQSQGAQRVITGNGLPKHPTGVYPIQASDDAYQYDRNPNAISSQSISARVPANPEVATSPSCVPGEVGYMLDGIAIFSAFDAGGRDAPAHEVQDNCDGHPQNRGQYHYHSYSDCAEDTAREGQHSSLLGYAYDGFGIFGLKGEGGVELTNADLDACHGHTHEIDWDGQKRSMYHYHFTREFPYTIGCFMGTPQSLPRPGM